MLVMTVNDIISKGGIPINSKMKNFVTKVIRHGQTTEINFIQLNFFCKSSLSLKHVQDLKTAITLNSICNKETAKQPKLFAPVARHDPETVSPELRNSFVSQLNIWVFLVYYILLWTIL